MAYAKEIVKRVFEEPWTGKFDAIDEFVALDFVGYDAAEPEPIKGPAGAKANVEEYLAGLDDALSDYLDSPKGRFAQWLAERDRRGQSVSARVSDTELFQFSADRSTGPAELTRLRAPWESPSKSDGIG